MYFVTPFWTEPKLNVCRRLSYHPGLIKFLARFGPKVVAAVVVVAVVVVAK